jgi:metal-responsive CopG/Arc/MetJ family transcriptional regulator
MTNLSKAKGKTMVSMRLPEDLVTQVDERAGQLGISRSQWFENMTRWVLDHTETVAGED